jgi:predicted PurR-regulated permease PerM
LSTTEQESSEEEELLHASIKVGAAAQVTIAAIAAIGLIYLLKIVMVTALIAVLLSFVLDPLVTGLSKLHVPRAIGASIAVMLLVAACAGLTYLTYNQAVGFAEDLPKYSSRLRDTFAKLRNQTQKLEDTTRAVMPDPPGAKKAIPVEVRESPGLSRIVSTSAGQFGEIVLSITFIPFLVYFMLTWKAKAHSNTLQLFPKEHRLVAYRTIGRISLMMRSFIVGNLMLGLVASGVSTVIFWAIGLPYPYFLGVISGFMSLIPYLGCSCITCSVRGWRRVDDSHQRLDHRSDGRRSARTHDERSISADHWQEASFESARIVASATVLGLDMGCYGTDSGGPYRRSDQDRLRLCGFPARSRSVVGRLVVRRSGESWRSS